MIRFVLLVCLMIYSCSSKSFNTDRDNRNENIQWNTYSDTIETGFILTFQYPNKLILAVIIDNCRCVGEKTEYYNENEASENANTNQWCICMHDTNDASVDNLLSSWKSYYKGEIVEQRDSITIEDFIAFRITLNSKTQKDSYRELIYMKKYSTIFEIMNVNEATKNDFERFYKSIRIDEYSKQ